MFVSKELKDINVKVFKMITNKNEAKTMAKHVSCNSKWKFTVEIAIQIKNGIAKYVNVNVKIIVHRKRYHAMIT